MLAIHAGGIFDKANFYNSITEATADCAICAGTTRRRGKKRGKLLLPEEFAEMADEITGAPVVSTLRPGSGTAGSTTAAPLDELLHRKEIFGVDLFEAGLAETVKEYFAKLDSGAGTVRKTLKEI